MENPKANCLLVINDFLKSPLIATNQHFLDLVNSAATLIEYTSEIMKDEKNSDMNPTKKNLMIINFSQMISSLEFLSGIVEEEHNISLVLEECRKVALSRVKFCLDLVEKNLLENEIPRNESGQFLRWMDNALDCIAKINVDDGKQIAFTRLAETKFIYEDILAHAMSIAQICLDDDIKAINGSCRSVLDILDDLQKELNKTEPNKAMVSLFVDDAGNKLCSLERKVDVAVLRLSLYVFSRYRVSLEKLHTFCESNINESFNQKELDDIIVEFDLHVDRIFQIGLFAVFCSSNIRSGNNIQNCMASLEFLESELVPALQMILKESSIVHRTSALIYKNYWISEAEKLKTLVYEIIDPSAFCKVIYDEIVFQIDSILEQNEEDKTFKKKPFGDILNIGRVLIDFMSTVVRIETNTDKSIKDTVKKCHIITCEISAAIEILEDGNASSHSRILKRCKILQAQTKKLICLLKNSTKLDNKDDDSNNEHNGNQLSSDSKENMEQNITFSQIKFRGKEILENRSIMYRTPKKCYNTKNTNPENGDPSSLDSFLKKLSNSAISLSFHSSDKTTSFSANINDLLTNLSKLSTSIVEENQ